MPKPTPPKTKPLNHNELLVVCKHNNEFTYWTAWKRAICAFNDPRMWNDPSVWPEYFEQQKPQKGRELTWGMQGYGVIVADMDSKTIWSINDYSTPSSVFLPNAHVVLSQDDVSIKAFSQLLKDKNAPDETMIECTPERVRSASEKNGKSIEPQKISLRDLIGTHDSLEKMLYAATLKYGCFTDQLDQKWMVFGGSYIPQGWTEKTDLGQSALDVLTDLLAHAAAQNFPTPDMENLNDWAQEKFADQDDPDLAQARFEKALSAWDAPQPTPPHKKAKLK